jgi:hypothetical protein
MNTSEPLGFGRISSEQSKVVDEPITKNARIASGETTQEFVDHIPFLRIGRASSWTRSTPLAKQRGELLHQPVDLIHVGG